ncbi:hypothetical protein ANO11243_010790 [Dothideomycetidae sp. 11243]|nr:hypothetical protein ANO11243_010790 [fungal sp. No.11243]
MMLAKEREAPRRSQMRVRKDSDPSPQQARAAQGKRAGCFSRRVGLGCWSGGWRGGGGGEWKKGVEGAEGCEWWEMRVVRKRGAGGWRKGSGSRASLDWDWTRLLGGQRIEVGDRKRRDRRSAGLSPRYNRTKTGPEEGQSKRRPATAEEEDEATDGVPRVRKGRDTRQAN